MSEIALPAAERTALEERLATLEFENSALERALRATTAERMAIEMQLISIESEVEEKVEKRTAELREANDRLQAEVEALTRNQAALSESSAILERVFSTMHTLLAYLDTDLRFIRVNRAYAEADGKPVDYFPGRAHFELYPYQENEALFRHVIATGEPFFAHAKPFRYAAHPERGTTWWNLGLIPVKDAQGTVTGLLLSLVDVTDTERAVAALQKSERELQVRNEIANCFLTCSEDQVLVGVLRTILRAIDSRYGAFGYIREDGALVVSAAAGECAPPTDESVVIHPSVLGDCLIARAIAEKHVIVLNESSPVQATHPPIHRAVAAPVVFASETIGLVMVANKQTDYTDEEARMLGEVAGRIAPILRARLDAQREERQRRELEAELLQSQKLEAIGRLAGGVAHDFNNMLTAIAHFARVTSLVPELPQRALDATAQILRAAGRAGAITRQLLAFGRKQVLQPEVLNLNTTLEAMAGMLPALLGEDIRFNVELAPALWNVELDPVQIEQVLMNLAVNARDAMPSGGCITVTTSNVEIAEPLPASGSVVPQGSWVVLTMSDTGCGMTPEIREHIFEPFFTTKEQGKGSGLGLSTVYGIVRQSGGFIHVESEPGAGTTFRIFLPASASEALSRAPAIEDGPAISGHGCILLAEDDELVRIAVIMMLEELGYRVLAASNVATAIELFESNHEDIDLVISDMVMPDGTGTDLYAKLSSRRSVPPPVFMSGYVDDLRLQLNHAHFFIQKPFTIEQLRAKLAEAMKERERSVTLAAIAATPCAPAPDSGPTVRPPSVG